MGGDANKVTIHWNNHAQILAKGIQHFFKDQYLVDAHVNIGGAEGVPAHRMILALFLPAFKASMDGVQGGQLRGLNLGYVTNEIDDVRALVDFVYTGAMTVAKDRLEHLGRLAEILQFDGLAKVISQLMSGGGGSRRQQPSRLSSAAKNDFDGLPVETVLEIIDDIDVDEERFVNDSDDLFQESFPNSPMTLKISHIEGNHVDEDSLCLNDHDQTLCATDASSLMDCQEPRLPESAVANRGRVQHRKRRSRTLTNHRSRKKKPKKPTPTKNSTPVRKSKPVKKATPDKKSTPATKLPVSKDHAYELKRRLPRQVSPPPHHRRRRRRTELSLLLDEKDQDIVKDQVADVVPQPPVDIGPYVLEKTRHRRLVRAQEAEEKRQQRRASTAIDDLIAAEKLLAAKVVIDGDVTGNKQVGENFKVLSVEHRNQLAREVRLNRVRRATDTIAVKERRRRRFELFAKVKLQQEDRLSKDSETLQQGTADEAESKSKDDISTSRLNGQDVASPMVINHPCEMEAPSRIDSSGRLSRCEVDTTLIDQQREGLIAVTRVDGQPDNERSTVTVCEDNESVCTRTSSVGERGENENLATPVQEESSRQNAALLDTADGQCAGDNWTSRADRLSKNESSTTSADGQKVAPVDGQSEELLSPRDVAS